MTTKRSYHDACGTAHALDLIGERWALLVVRELLLGSKRYSDLRKDLPGISTNVLSHRLDELEEGGVVRRRTLPPPASSRVYELTEWGLELEPVIQQLGRWGSRSPAHPRDAQISPTSFVLSLRTNFDPQAATGVHAAYELRLGEHSFHATVADGVFEVTRGSAPEPDATIEGPPGALASVMYGERDLTDAANSNGLAIEGDLTAVERFLAFFSLPEPVAEAVREQGS
ncbi:winged helix-turn-helix transcriptional regulator [Streptomyces zagrosensis]|uniref:DNA-binding HxlR family transcriptional regulator n=1 Tax=Streptomyces zagrosensis TaxID=1042984 RepID=A0A7W9V037_9ACTN|nr:winged helix-turn-helix transcriptional regulator [Streptomyces zagrosensis]MBB5936931.1 DNA-binding HxlR family transcriptional regulator [Streptomyces zagrosensis]